MKNPSAQVFVEIPHLDPSFKKEIDVLKQDLRDDGVIAFETQRGLLESRVRATAPAQIIEFLDYTKYAAVFMVTSYFAGIIGQVGADHYKKLVSWIKNLQKKNNRV